MCATVQGVYAVSARVAAFESDNINLLQCLNEFYGDDYETLLSVLPVSSVLLQTCNNFVMCEVLIFYCNMFHFFTIWLVAFCSCCHRVGSPPCILQCDVAVLMSHSGWLAITDWMRMKKINLACTARTFR